MKQDEFDFDAPREAPRSTASAAILERIKKLLRLAADKRGNAHEAERAAQLAFELAEKHHVDVLSLDLDEAQEKIVGEYFPGARKRDRLRDGVRSIISRFFHCQLCGDGDRILFVGRETDVAIAGYVYIFLMRAGRDCLRAYEAAEKKARRKVTFTKRANYTAGFLWGLNEKLRASRAAMVLDDCKSALVVAEAAKREAKMDELIPGRVKQKALPDPRRNWTAATHGYRDGKATQINTPLAPARKEVLALHA